MTENKNVEVVDEWKVLVDTSSFEHLRALSMVEQTRLNWNQPPTSRMIVQLPVD